MLKRFLSVFLSVLTLICTLSLVGCGQKSEGFASPNAAVEALYRTLQKDSVENYLSCYPPQVRDYIIQQAGGKKAYEAEFKTNAIEPSIIKVYYVDQDTEEMANLCEQAKQAYADQGLDVPLEKYAEAYCELIVNGEQSQATDEVIPCCMVGGKWYVIY